MTTKPRPRPPRGGFTLMEVLVSMGLGGLAVGTAMALVLYAARNMAGMANYTDLSSSGVQAMDQLTSDIRQTVKLISFSTNTVVFDDGAKGDLTFTFTNNALLRKQGTTTRELLSGVGYGEFAMFQRTTISNSYNQYAATNVDDCKALVVKWNCSRSLIGTNSTVENGQTARIVIRKN